MATELELRFGAVITRALGQRGALGLPSSATNCYRLVHGAADGLDGVTIDVYGRFVVVSLLRDYAEVELSALFDAVLAAGFLGIYLKRRPRQANALNPNELRVRAPEGAVRGEEAQLEIEVCESSMPFLVRLGDGLSTGLFLDQRENRARLRACARDKRVLNLFAYTCAFGCAAALGGARETTNIDVSKAVLDRGRRGYVHAGLGEQGHRFLARDVLEGLPKLARGGERYDIVILDPPSYASTRRGRFSVEKHFVSLVAQAMALVSAGGQLLACTNLQSLQTQAFERMVREGAAQAGRAVGVELTRPPGDFPVPVGVAPHMKSAWVTVR